MEECAKWMIFNLSYMVSTHDLRICKLNCKTSTPHFLYHVFPIALQPSRLPSPFVMHSDHVDIVWPFEQATTMILALIISDTFVICV